MGQEHLRCQEALRPAQARALGRSFQSPEFLFYLVPMASRLRSLAVLVTRRKTHDLENSTLSSLVGTGDDAPMKHRYISRRTVLGGSGALLASAAFSTRVMASAPPPDPVTPALIQAAKKEAQVIYYTSTDLPVAETSEGLRGEIFRNCRARRAY